MASIQIYAELLVNIRQVTVYVTLPSPTNHGTTFELSSDSEALRVFHDQNKSEFPLPCRVAEIADLKKPVLGLTEISFRLQIPNEPQTVADDCASMREQHTIWPASAMALQTQIACRSCRNIVVKDTVLTWKNLPSENWAEMMDFWHCHKPHVESLHRGSNKGYDASDRLFAQPGIGFVDTLHFLLTEGDCTGIEKSIDSVSTIECTVCASVLGNYRDDIGSVQLDKWSLSLRAAKQQLWAEYSVQNFTCAKLLELIESQAIYTYLACSGDNTVSQNALLLWVLTPDLKYSTSALEAGPRRAMKILYQSIDDPSAALQRQGMKVDELKLPDHILPVLMSNLDESNQFLPASARKFREWNVGLLQR